MDWFIFALVAPIIVSISNIVDKYIFSKYVKNVYSFQPIFHIAQFPLLIIFAFFIELNFDIFAVIGLVAGAFCSFTYILYNKAMIKEEASRVITLSYMQPIFVLILGFALLGESASFLNILGILALISSAVLVSYKKAKKGSGFSFSLLKLMIMFDILVAVYYIIVRFSVQYVTPYQFFFWASLGCLPASLLLLLSKDVRRSFIMESKKMMLKGYLIKMAGSVANIIGYLSLYVALSMEGAALVSSVMATQPFFVFLYAAVLTIILPSVMKEDLGKKSIAMKIAACALILVGSYLIVA